MSLGVIGRMQAGMTLDAAQRKLIAISRQLAQEHPWANAGSTFRVTPLRDAVVGDEREAPA